MSFLRRSVNDNFWRASARKRFADAVQLELPLDHQAYRRMPLSVLAIGQMRGADIVNSISEIGPKVIIDVREFPRFDMPGSNRAMIFDAIDFAGANYEQRPLPWSKTNFGVSSAYLTGEIYNYAESARLLSGAALLFVSSLDHKRLIDVILDRSIS